MSAKYECPKCGRKFTDWGAEKLGYKCPHDAWCPPDATGEIELVPVEGLEDRSSRRAILRRSLRRQTLTPKPAEVDTDEALVPDIEEIEPETALQEEEDFKLLGSEDEVETPLVATTEGTVHEDVPLDLEESLPYTEDIPGAEDTALDRLEETDDTWSE